MIEEIKRLLYEYNNWLKDKTALEIIDDDWVQITTPYLDRHNDCLEIYAKKESGGFILTDDGYIINDLINSGCALDTPKRKELLNLTLAGFGVGLVNNQLIVKTNEANFSLKKHNLIQSMLGINDLFYLSSPVISSLFYEEIVSWLDLSEIRYTPKVKFTGKSGYDHLFDFVIPKSSSEPERILQSVNNPKKEQAEALVFKWIDTKTTRSPESLLFAVLNDKEKEISPSVTDALKNYDAIPIV
ncbi:MAG: DUF1829 domain-containing protein, partial [Planctomycetia bacterium]|nr:DUF1829 domain-containing protein [Planctomycetia bacterium]